MPRLHRPMVRDEGTQAEQSKPTTAEVPIVAAGTAAGIAGGGTQTQAPDPIYDTLAPGTQLGFGGGCRPASGVGATIRRAVSTSWETPEVAPSHVGERACPRTRRRPHRSQRTKAEGHADAPTRAFSVASLSASVLFTLLILAIPVAAFFVVRMGTPMTTGIRRCKATPSSSRTAGVAECCGSSPRWSIVPGSAPRRFSPRRRAQIAAKASKNRRSRRHGLRRERPQRLPLSTVFAGTVGRQRRQHRRGPSGVLPTTTLPSTNAAAVPPLPGAATTTTTLAVPQ